MKNIHLTPLVPMPVSAISGTTDKGMHDLCVAIVEAETVLRRVIAAEKFGQKLPPHAVRVNPEWIRVDVENQVDANRTGLCNGVFWSNGCQELWCPAQKLLIEKSS